MRQPAFLSLPPWLAEILADPFRRNLFLALALLGAVLAWFGPAESPEQAATERAVHFYFHPQCPHCQKQKIFNHALKARYPEAVFVEHDTSRPGVAEQLAGELRARGMPTSSIGVPMTFMGPRAISGFLSDETTGVLLERSLQAYLRGERFEPGEAKESGPRRDVVALPLLGEIRPDETSLFALAVILGLVDGFNPCAMWVLVYLISLIAMLNDRRKVWFLVGSFVAASGVLYFLFMTAWLNVFLVLGYLRFLTLAIGLVALGAGVLALREWWQARGGELACTIGDAQSRRKTMGRIERLVSAPLSAVTICGVVALAFIVNSIEFACSAALPAIFTHTLTLRHLPRLHYYGYILLYDLFFMLDDLVIFGLAALALDTKVGHRYARHCRLVGGVVLVALGVLMAFQPEWLR